MSIIRSPASIEHLENLMEFVTGCTRESGFAGKRIKEIELATEEVLVNIFNYAYPEENGDVQVSCTLNDENKFVIEILDNGIPFNSLSLPDPDLTTDISKRQIGGLGIFLTRKMVDDVQYRREAGSNILTLIFSKEYEQ